jgi:hypothetical protein
MAQKKAENQTSSLTPDEMLRIDPNFVRVGYVQHTVEKLLMRTITLLQTLTQ